MVCATRLPPIKPNVKASELHIIEPRLRLKKLGGALGEGGDVLETSAMVEVHRRRYQ